MLAAADCFPVELWTPRGLPRFPVLGLMHRASRRGQIAGISAEPDGPGGTQLMRCFRHQLLLPRPYLVLTKPLRLDIQCQRAASVKIGWKYLDD